MARQAKLTPEGARAAILHAVSKAVGKELRASRQYLRTDLEYDLTFALAGNVHLEAISMLGRGTLSVLPDKTRRDRPDTRRLVGMILANLPARTRQNLLDVLDERMKSQQPVPEEFDRMAGNLLATLSIDKQVRGDVKWAGELIDE